jgi:aspartyl-tRNA(Asn)/glutamyl-tRNA(Gln) amidotransferase subunit B
LINDKKLCDVFEEGLKHSQNAKALCNWMTVEFIGRIKSSGKTLSEFGIKAAHIAELVSLIDNGVITGRMAKDIADDMVASPGTPPREIVAKNPNYRPMTDLSEME